MIHIKCLLFFALQVSEDLQVLFIDFHSFPSYIVEISLLHFWKRVTSNKETLLTAKKMVS